MTRGYSDHTRRRFFIGADHIPNLLLRETPNATTSCCVGLRFAHYDPPAARRGGAPAGADPYPSSEFEKAQKPPGVEFI
jgi:hypothetical protein